MVGAFSGGSNDLLHLKLSKHWLLKPTAAAVGGVVWDWAVHWGHCSHGVRDGAEGCAGLRQLSSPAFSLLRPFA